MARRHDDPRRHGAGRGAAPGPHHRLDGRRSWTAHVAARCAGSTWRRSPTGPASGSGPVTVTAPASTGAAARRRRCDWGTAAADEPAGDGHVAGRVGGPPAAGQRQPARAARPRPRLGPAARRARVGLPDGAADAASGWSSRCSALGTPTWVTDADFDLSRHVHRVRLPAPGSMRQLLDMRAGVRRRAVRPRAPAVGRAAGGGPRRRPGRVPDQEPPQRHRRARRGPADDRGCTAAPPEHDPQPARAAGPPRRSRRRGSGCSPGRWRARSGLRRLRRCGRAPGSLGALARPWETASRAAGRAAGAARSRAAARPRPRGSALLATRGGGWHFEVVDVPLADLKAGAKAARRFAQRRAAGRGDRRVPPLPRAARRPARPAHRRVPDQPAQPRTTRRAGTGSPAPGSPRPWPSATRPPGSPPCGSSC